MTARHPQDVLVRVRDYYTDRPERWIRGPVAIDVDGNECDPCARDRAVIARSLVGAIWNASYQSGRMNPATAMSARQAVLAVARTIGLRAGFEHDDLAKWNAAQSFEVVMAAVNFTIERLGHELRASNGMLPQAVTV